MKRERCQLWGLAGNKDGQRQSGRLFEFAKNLIGLKIAELLSRLKCEFDISVPLATEQWVEHAMTEDCFALMVCRPSQSHRWSSWIKVYTVHRLESKEFFFAKLNNAIVTSHLWLWSLIAMMMMISIKMIMTMIVIVAGVNLSIPPAALWPVPAS